MYMCQLITAYKWYCPITIHYHRIRDNILQAAASGAQAGKTELQWSLQLTYKGYIHVLEQKLRHHVIITA